MAFSGALGMRCSRLRRDLTTTGGVSHESSLLVPEISGIGRAFPPESAVCAVPVFQASAGVVTFGLVSWR
jgi:hypothetical protein